MLPGSSSGQLQGVGRLCGPSLWNDPPQANHCEHHPDLIVWGGFHMPELKGG